MKNSTFIGELKTWRNIHMKIGIHNASKINEKICKVYSMRTFSLHSTDAFGLLNGHDGTSQTVHNRLWWVLWHANELNAAAPTDSRPNTWGSRLVRSVPCDCRVKAGGQRGGGGRWGWWLVVQFGSPSVATSGGYYKHTFQTNRERRERRIRSVERFSRNTEVKNRSKWRTEQNRMESKEQQ